VLFKQWVSATRKNEFYFSALISYPFAAFEIFCSTHRRRHLQSGGGQFDSQLVFAL